LTYNLEVKSINYIQRNSKKKTSNFKKSSYRRDTLKTNLKI
jgi:hypothetical protein